MNKTDITTLLSQVGGRVPEQKPEQKFEQNTVESLNKVSLYDTNVYLFNADIIDKTLYEKVDNYIKLLNEFKAKNLLNQFNKLPIEHITKTITTLNKTTTFNKIKTFNKIENELPIREQNMMISQYGSSLDLKKKYIKYKTKYNNLKNKIMHN